MMGQNTLTSKPNSPLKQCLYNLCQLQSSPLLFTSSLCRPRKPSTSYQKKSSRKALHVRYEFETYMESKKFEKSKHSDLI